MSHALLGTVVPKTKESENAFSTGCQTSDNKINSSASLEESVINVGVVLVRARKPTVGFCYHKNFSLSTILVTPIPKFVVRGGFVNRKAPCVKEGLFAEISFQVADSFIRERELYVARRWNSFPKNRNNPGR